MVKFRQLIRPGQRGRDVLAVKDGMQRMGVHDSESMNKRSNKAGPEFVRCVRRVQRHHGLKEDGIYGKMTHKIVAPHFTAWDRFRYRRAKLRRPKHPPIPKLSAQAAAHRLLDLHAQGRYHADNPGDLYDIQRTAKGLPVWSPLGYWVHIDKRVLEALVFLIEEKNYKIGTFALCSDHHTIDGRHGHNGGHAVDIDSINGIPIKSWSSEARRLTLEVATILRHHMPATLTPWQQICYGYGYHHDSEIAACTLPSIGFYNYSTLLAHENHIHFGYWGN